MTGRESGFRLVLRNGVELDALGEALEFIEKDGTYYSYDLAPVEQDNTLTEADVRAANRIIARIDPHCPPVLSMGHRCTISPSGVVSRSWNLYRPSRLTRTSPAASSPSRCWEMA